MPSLCSRATLIVVLAFAAFLSPAIGKTQADPPPVPTQITYSLFLPMLITVDPYLSLTNLALDRPTRASSIENNQLAAKWANDGDTKTRWSSRPSASLNTEWWRVDIGGQNQYNQVVIYWEAAYSTCYFVGHGNDPNGDPRRLSGNWYKDANKRLFNMDLSRDRYVYVYMKNHRPGYQNFSLYEVKVYRTNSTPDAASTEGIEDAGETTPTINCP
jgi:hypothetical protein